MNPYVSTEFGENYVAVTVCREGRTLIITVIEDGTVVTENRNGEIFQATLKPVGEGNRGA